MSRDLENCLIRILKTEPGLPAKIIAQRARDLLSDRTVTKRIVNPVLYRKKLVFRYVGQTPPKWYLREEATDLVLNRLQALLNNAKNDSKKQNRSIPTKGKAPKKPRIKVLGAAQKKTTKLHPLSKDLYDWQHKAIKAWEDSNCCGVVEAVTGTGKTFVAIWLLHKYIQEQKRCLVIVPSVVLFNQWKEEIESELGFELSSLLGAGHKCYDPSQPITLGVLKSVAAASEIDELDGSFDLLISDECHRLGSDKHKFALLEDVNDRLGLTATFERSDDGVDEVLKPYFSGARNTKTCVCFKYDFKRAKKDQIIAPFVSLSIGVNLSLDEMEEYIDCGKRMQKSKTELVSEYGYPNDFKRFMSYATKKKLRSEGILFNNFLSAMTGRKRILSESRAKGRFLPQLGEIISYSKGTIVYVETKDAAEQFAESLREYDFNTEPFHSGIRQVDREAIFERFRSKDTRCLMAVHCLDEGVNVPDANCAIVIASTKQKRQMVQRMGRVLRKKYDETGSVFIHIYARNTAEDPENNKVNDEHYLSVLTNEAECTDILDSEIFEDYDVLPWIREFVHWE